MFRWFLQPNIVDTSLQTIHVKRHEKFERKSSIRQQCSKLAVARLPETTKSSFRHPVLGKIKGRLAEKNSLDQPEKNLSTVLALLCA